MQADGAGWNAHYGSCAGDQVLFAEAGAGPEGKRNEGLKNCWLLIISAAEDSVYKSHVNSEQCYEALETPYCCDGC